MPKLASVALPPTSMLAYAWGLPKGSFPLELVRGTIYYIFIMLYIFDCWNPTHASLFQSGWFVESLLTQTLD